MRYYISSHCKYVKGHQAGAIYDLKSNKIYRINADGCEVLDNLFRDVRNEEYEKYIDFIDTMLGLKLISEAIETTDCCEPLPPQLTYAWLELTDKCNMNCIHCYGEFGHPECLSKGEYLSLEEWKQILRELRQNKLQKVQFIGGEPLLYSHFKELLLYAYELGFEIDVFTNGYFIDKEMAELFKRTGTSVRVSLYGYDDSSHEIITNCPGSFKKTDRALTYLKDCNVRASTAVVIMQENEADFDRIKKYIEEKGYLFSYDTIRQTCKGSQSRHCISNVELLESRYFTKPDFSVSENIYRKNIGWNSCWFGKVAISATGDIMPCTFARDMICGNLRKDSQHDIQKRLLDYWSYSKDKVEDCNVCEYRYACHDCRPLSNSVTGNMEGKYPRCCYNPIKGEWENINKVARFEIKDK